MAYAALWILLFNIYYYRKHISSLRHCLQTQRLKRILWTIVHAPLSYWHVMRSFTRVVFLEDTARSRRSLIFLLLNCVFSILTPGWSSQAETWDPTYSS